MSKATLPLQEWDIERLIPYEKNAKIHTPAQINKIARSIEKHGLVNPPNVETDGTIITGHGRTLALKQLGWKKVPVFVRSDLTKAEAAAARIADNKVAEGDTDTGLLQEELRWLEGEDIGDLLDLGFEERELAFLTEDLGSLNDDLLDGASLVLDESAVNSPAEPEEDAVEAAERASVAIGKVLGIKDVSASQGRVLSRFMATVCEEVGIEDPAAALCAFAVEVMADE